jgi:ferredoxin/flavodoxin---NADP+ reductase
VRTDAGAQLHVAIVGSGPAALYSAAELARVHGEGLHVQVNMIERLPVAGGLARAGVAPDHAERRRMIEVYERLARSTGCLRFYGNVEVGKHVSHADLLRHHDAVIYAIGASAGRALGIPGEGLPGCHAATDLVGWYNGHPDFGDRVFDFGVERAIVVGNGNVALDVARMLLLEPQALAATDIVRHAWQALAGSRVREVQVLGRRGPAQAAFTNPELLAIGQLPGVDVQVDDADLDGVACKDRAFASALRRSILQGYAWSGGATRGKRLVLRFRVSPLEICGRNRVEGLRLVGNDLVDDGSGQLQAVPNDRAEYLDAGLVIHAVGYRGVGVPGLPFDAHRAVIPNRGGRVLDESGGQALAGSYVAGWIKRGPSGAIGSNRACARETVHAIVEDFRCGRLRRPQRGFDGFAAFLRLRQPALVTCRGWRAIGRLERQQAAVSTAGSRLSRFDEMLRVAADAQTGR